MLWKWLKSSLRARLSLWEIQLSCTLTEVQMEEKTEEATVQKERKKVFNPTNVYATQGYSHIVNKELSTYNLQ